jgi:hypothetical protein
MPARLPAAAGEADGLDFNFIQGNSAVAKGTKGT